MRLQDLAILTSTPVDTDKVLFEKFKAHDRVIHDPKTNLFSYRVCVFLLLPLCPRRLKSAPPLQHDYNVRNKAALLTEIQRQTRKGSGLSVRTLKESWKEAPQAIEELEKEGEVLVTRTQKDGQARMVFWNEVKDREDQGGARVEKGTYCPCTAGSPPNAQQSSSISGMGLRFPMTWIYSRPWRTRVCRRRRQPRL